MLHRLTREVRRLLHLPRVPRSDDERGVIAILVALILTVLLIGAAMVLDFGLVRVDRQVNKSAADSAAVAGLQGMKSSDESARPFTGVCNAIRYLQANHDRFNGVTSTAGTWTDGNGAPVGVSDVCADLGLREKACIPGDMSSWARFTWTGSWQGEPLQVVIQSGYEVLPTGWKEDTLQAAQDDRDDGAQGCYQLMVTVTQNRDPGLGSLATSADLVSSIRSVGRVKAGPGGDAPAMLLLKRSGCPILQAATGGGSFLRVYGAVATGGRTQAGSIHADSSGTGCSGGSNQNIFLGRDDNGIVAFAAPLASDPTQPDPSKPGQISSVAGSTGISANNGIIRDRTGGDWNSRVYAAHGIDETSPGLKTGPTGRPLVTRKLVDERYLGAVKGITDTAQSSVFGSLTAANAEDPANGYLKVGCGATGSVSGPRIFVDCTDNVGFKGPVNFTNADTVVFNGRVNPAGEVAMPQATKVYVFGIPTRPAIELGTGSALRVHTNGQSVCTSNQTGAKAVMVIKDGPFKQSGTGTLQMCNTTVVMMSGQSGACLPTVGYATAAPPDTTPCGSPANLVGTGQLDQTGGSVDWTAPNEYDVMTDDAGDPLPFAAAAWADEDGPEDLAFWSESGTSPSDTFNVNGGGVLRTAGVYMVPNADSFIISGSGCQQLTDAQYIATSIRLGGGTCIEMSVDPNAAVTLPKLELIGLVR